MACGTDGLKIEEFNIFISVCILPFVESKAENELLVLLLLISECFACPGCALT